MLFHSNKLSLTALYYLFAALLFQSPRNAVGANDVFIAPEKKPQPMLVIGAGLPRTGTASLQRAVTVLGYKSYHMQNALGDAADIEQWVALAEGTASFNDTANFISRQGYNATFDYPTSDYVAEYLQLYPNAKVVLSVRDSATEWSESFQVLQELVLAMEQPFTWTYPNWIPLLMPERTVNYHKIRCHLGTNTLHLSPCELLFGLGQDIEFLKQHYEKHNRRIREIVPPEQLLEFNVKEGWGPLCDFLGRDVPERGFPHKGKAVQFRRGSRFCKGTTYLWIPALLCMVLFILKRGYGLVRGRTNVTGETKLKQS